MRAPISVFWFRRDLRLEDHQALFEALRAGYPVLGLYVFDRIWLDRKERRDHPGVDVLHQAVCSLYRAVEQVGSRLMVHVGTPEEAFREISRHWEIRAVFVGDEYEPEALKRFENLRRELATTGASWISIRDRVVFAPNDILKKDGTPYTVFTPYARAWKAQWSECSREPVPSGAVLQAFLPRKEFSWLPGPAPTLEQLGFSSSGHLLPTPQLQPSLLHSYHLHRDFPAVEGTSRCGVALSLGTIGVRHIVRLGLQHNEVFLNELIWREFFVSVLYHFPYVERSAFKKRYDAIPWRNHEPEFERWCHGQTGYPLVDAGMRQLLASGWMHNRVRMVAASFLVKHLLIDWRWGEAWFASLLLDYDLSANNGNWQWVAGTGCDAAPYFRVFHPMEQARKFDPSSVYIKTWVPEWGTPEYPQAMVSHPEARVRALEAYRAALGKT